MNEPLKTTLSTQTLPVNIDDLTVKISELEPFFDGSTEVHFNFNDLYMVIAGKATVSIGRKFVGGTEIEVGEIRNCIIEMSVEYNLEKGDILFIPAGFAHKIKVGSDKFIQYVLKIPVDKKEMK